mgnify:FL=1|mmetsp:Transcript_10680/g.15985  ORF Transcript_10680/g.15985 Transcript_10680/m.15985 type:complete len:221 (-) Transcript_10680:3492-4154(-)
MDIVLWLFTLGYLFQVAASCILVVKMQKQKSIYGMCPDTQWVFFIATLSRCVWIFDTRLMGLPLAYIELISNVVLGAYCCYLCHKYKHTVEYSTSKYLDAISISVCCLVLCFLFHPGAKNQFYLTVQMLVSFTIFMESAGLLPQFLMMRKSKEVETMTGHYLMCLGTARLFRLFFWINMYLEGETFGYLIIADILHSVLLADFAYIYYNSMKTGKPILLS